MTHLYVLRTIKVVTIQATDFKLKQQKSTIPVVGSKMLILKPAVGQGLELVPSPILSY
jgi:hypothetical protein